jgi:signal transduction histidine kinase
MYYKFIILLLILPHFLYSNEKISIQLLWKHQFEFAGFYVAKEKGFYKDVGLDVDIKEFDFGVNIINDVMRNKSDIGIGRSSLVLNRLNGKDIVLLKALYQSTPYVLISKKRKDLNSIKDFKYKKIMLSDDLNSLAAIYSMMKVNNIKNTDYIEVAHSFDINDLIKDKVDLVTTYLSNEPYHLKEKGIPYTIFDPKDYGFDLYADILFTSKAYLEQNPKKIKKFIKATLKGWKYAFANIEETSDLILKKYNTQNKTKKALIFEANTLKELAYKKDIPFGDISETKIIEIANIYRLLDITNKTNERLEDFIYKDYTFFDKYSFEIFTTIISILLLVGLLALYKQYILRKQNTYLDEVVQEKTKELKELNEHLEEKIENRTQELQALNKNLENEVKQRITEIREKEQLLIQQSKLASMGEMMGNIAHQWRQPLNSIALKKEILVADYYDNTLSDEIVEQFSDNLDDTLQYMSKTIDDFRDFFKPTKEKIDFDVFKNIESILTIVDAQLKNHDIKLYINNHYNQPIIFFGYPTEFKQVLINLVNNAKDAIVANNPKSRQIDIDIYYDEMSKEIEVYVSDFAGGVPNDVIDKIFEPYFTTKFKAKGTGLGLYMSKVIIEYNMHGKLDVQNINGGARFIIKLK